VTGAKGWARFAFKPPYDATYFAHYGGNSHAAPERSERRTSRREHLSEPGVFGYSQCTRGYRANTAAGLLRG
jgi:hypothetical protein